MPPVLGMVKHSNNDQDRNGYLSDVCLMFLTFSKKGHSFFQKPEVKDGLIKTNISAAYQVIYSVYKPWRSNWPKLWLWYIYI